MAGEMLNFIHLDQRYPDKRCASERREDFNEIYESFDVVQAAEQSSRCSQCGIPFCQVHCPLQNNIPDWLYLTTQGRLKEAYQMSSMTNSMPEICGRICPQDRLCEGNCTIEQSTHGTVTIGAIEKYLTDMAWEKGWVQGPKVLRELKKTVGIIGSGPAGLAAAEQLRAKGYGVDVYDRYDRMGGLLIYGIPSFKLEKDVVKRRVDLLADSGVRFHHGCDVGKTISFEELKEKHDAILIATGVYKTRELGLKSQNLKGVYQALDYLTTSNKVGLGDHIDAFDRGDLNAHGKKVVVIGGGDTAMDCVRSALRQGAASVHCLYRRDQANMPGSQREVQHAQEEGAQFVWLSRCQNILGCEKNGVTGVRVGAMRLGVADASGRQDVHEVPGEEHVLQADMVIQALGFDPEELPCLFDEPALKVTRWGTVKVGITNMMTSVPGIFAAGDIARGASLVVWAIRDGRDAAEQIDQYLTVSNV